MTVILLNNPAACSASSPIAARLPGAGSVRATLSDYIDVPGAGPAGRLDRDSDGLLILTDDGALQGRISSAKHTTP